MADKHLPYFDFLLSQLAKNNSSVATSFGRHVHWGYWEQPTQAICDDEDYARAAERLTLELCALADITQGSHVLDVGCGFGGTVASLNERFDGMHLTGLNIDGRQLQRAQQQVFPLKNNHITFCQGDACVLPFPDASFDRLLAVECIFHFPSREKFFSEAFRVLKPGGTLTLSDFVPSSIFSPVAALSSSHWFSKFNYFGHCDVSYTLGRYKRLAKNVRLAPHGERNITRHTLPTYRYLQNLLSQSATPTAEHFTRLLRFMGDSNLLNYYLLSFRKP